MEMKNPRGGFSLLTTLIGVALSALVLVGVIVTLRFVGRADARIELSEELRDLREQAIRRIDCTQTMKTPPACTLKDHRGKPWPNASQRLGKFILSQSCTSTGVIILYRTAVATGVAEQGESLGVSSTADTQWNALFPDKPTLCEAETITPGTPSTPYYVLVQSPNIDVGACDYGDDSRKGRALSGAVACPLGYKVAGGGSTCGTQNGEASNYNAGQHIRASGSYYVYDFTCCSVRDFTPGTVYATCIRD